MKFVKLTISFYLLLIALVAYNQDKPAYILYNKKGNQVNYSTLEKSLKGKDVILFGEQHYCPISHWLELEVSKSLYAIDTNMVMGAEMFEADDQVVLNEYLEGLINEDILLSEVKLWINYTTDYKPLLKFAKAHQIPFIATNIPHRYARMVSIKGLTSLDDLDPKAKTWMAPIPIDVDLTQPGYKYIIDNMEGNIYTLKENRAYAQAARDATMAYFILTNLKGSFIHFNGTYHSNNYDGIYYYLKKGKSDISILTISAVKQKEIGSLEKNNLGLADFIICCPYEMTTTQ